MVRVVTQETYDEVVKENMEEFEMTAEEAVSEAIAQFKAQGVDLSHIIKDLVLNSDDNHMVCKAIQNLKNIENESDDMLLQEIQILKDECDKDMAHKVRAGKEGAYDILVKLLQNRIKLYLEDASNTDTTCILLILETLIALMDGQPDLLEVLGIELIQSILETVKDKQILMLTLKWARVCCVKHELNRQNLFSKGVVSHLKTLLKEQKNRKLLSESLQLIRKFTLDDDVRVEFGKAHDHAKEMGVELLDILVELIKEHKAPNFISELMLTTSSLLVRNELCASISHSVDTLVEILTDNYDNSLVAQQTCNLLTALAGNDDVKRKIIQAGVAPIIVSLLRRHSNDIKCCTVLLKCISVLCLREPDHGRQMLDCGAAEILVQCMKLYGEDAVIQKNACWAIRNMVARCKEYNSKFHELGVEAILNETYEKFGKDFGFDIKSALRDLECDVTLDEQWTGRGGEIDRS